MLLIRISEAVSFSPHKDVGILIGPEAIPKRQLVCQVSGMFDSSLSSTGQQQGNIRPDFFIYLFFFAHALHHASLKVICNAVSSV